MRARGNNSPADVSVEDYAKIPGYAEVRLRENSSEISVTDALHGDTVTMYEYDEYTMHIKDRAGLQAEIEANLSEWLATARSLETTGGESALVSAREENTELLTLVGEAVEAAYQYDLEVIDNV